MGNSGAKRRSARVVSIDSGGHRARLRRDKLILDHLYLVGPIAGALIKHCTSAFEVDDLEALGRVGLIQAAGRYRPRLFDNAPFAPYAKQRIRGAMLDGMRRKNWIEAQHESLNAILAARQAREDRDSPFCSPQEPREPSVGISVEAIDARRLLRRLVAGRLRRLSPLQTRILSLYYSDAAPTLQQIAARLKMPVEAISREHAAGLRALQVQFGVR